MGDEAKMDWKKELFFFLEKFNKVTLYLEFYHSIEMADDCFGTVYYDLCNASHNFTSTGKGNPHYEILLVVYILAKEANGETNATVRAERYYGIVNYILDRISLIKD